MKKTTCLCCKIADNNQTIAITNYISNLTIDGTIYSANPSLELLGSRSISFFIKFSAKSDGAIDGQNRENAKIDDATIKNPDIDQNDAEQSGVSEDEGYFEQNAKKSKNDETNIGNRQKNASNLALHQNDEVEPEASKETEALDENDDEKSKKWQSQNLNEKETIDEAEKIFPAENQRPKIGQLVTIFVYSPIFKKQFVLYRGKIEKIQSYDDKYFVIRFRSLFEAINENVTQTYSKTCRASLGDSRCQADITKLTINSIIKLIGRNWIMIDEGAKLSLKAKIHAIGQVMIGDNLNYVFPIKSVIAEEGKIFLFCDAKTKWIDKQITIIPGCDKQLETCINEYNNAINFRGEP